jgi:hypothetical protein
MLHPKFLRRILTLETNGKVLQPAAVADPFTQISALVATRKAGTWRKLPPSSTRISAFGAASGGKKELRGMYLMPGEPRSKKRERCLAAIETDPFIV